MERTENNKRSLSEEEFAVKRTRYDEEHFLVENILYETDEEEEEEEDDEFFVNTKTIKDKTITIKDKTYELKKDKSGQEYVDFKDTEFPIYELPEREKDTILLLRHRGDVVKAFTEDGKEVEIKFFNCDCCHNMGYEDEDAYTHCYKCGGYKTDYEHCTDKDCLEWLDNDGKCHI